MRLLLFTAILLSSTVALASQQQVPKSNVMWGTATKVINENFADLYANKADKSYVDSLVLNSLEYTDEMAQDAIGAMLTGNTETGIAVTYDDATNKINFVVNFSGLSSIYEPKKGSDDFFVTAAQKASIANFSGINTGDETATTIKTKLGIATLSGSNTGDQTNITGNAGTATTLQTARTIGGVSFDGSSNISLPGVNVVGNQNTTGSAATLTTPRTIGGTSFNGSANIDISYVNLTNKPTIPVASNTAYDATSWNGNLDVPTKDAIRDKIEALGAGVGGTYPSANNLGWTTNGTSWSPMGLDTDLSTVSSSDDTVPSAKSVRTAIDALPALTIETTPTTGANKVPSSAYALIADTDADGLPNKVDLSTAGLVKVDSSGVLSTAVAGTDYSVTGGTGTFAFDTYPAYSNSAHSSGIAVNGTTLAVFSPTASKWLTVALTDSLGTAPVGCTTGNILEETFNTAVGGDNTWTTGFITGGGTADLDFTAPALAGFSGQAFKSSVTATADSEAWKYWVDSADRTTVYGRFYLDVTANGFAAWLGERVFGYGSNDMYPTGMQFTISKDGSGNTILGVLGDGITAEDQIITTNASHRIEFYAVNNGATDTLQVKVDGTTLTTQSGALFTNSFRRMDIGFYPGLNPSAISTVLIDKLAISSTGWLGACD